MTLIYGSDFSSWQAPKPDMTGWGFAYVKATQGNNYINPYLVSQSTHVEKTVGQRGYYHYMDGNGSASQQADFFVNTIGITECKDTKVELWLDFEEPYLSVKMAKEFIDRVEKLTGKRCGLYTSQSWLMQGSGFDWRTLKSDTPIWMAMYPNNERAGNNITDAEWKWFYSIIPNIPHFETIHVWQFGAGAGYDWNVRLTQFPNHKQPSTPKPPNKPKPKFGQVITTRRGSWLYDEKGRNPKFPEGKRDWLALSEGSRVTFREEVGLCYHVEFYGYHLYIRKENF